MIVRFLTSVVTSTGSYMEGQRVALPTPMPDIFVGWLNAGVVEAVKEPTVERAVAKPGRRKKARTATGRADTMA